LFKQSMILLKVQFFQIESRKRAKLELWGGIPSATCNNEVVGKPSAHENGEAGFAV